MVDRKACLDTPDMSERLKGIRPLCQKCQKFGVLRLQAFETVCTPDFDVERSDVDILSGYLPGYQLRLQVMADSLFCPRGGSGQPLRPPGRPRHDRSTAKYVGPTRRQ